MPKSTKTDNIDIAGPAGRLESLYEQATDAAPVGCAVVCHPHPLHGGTMHNKVAHTLARGFLRSGFAVLRFNFRGTGHSEGRYDEGRGEVDDAVAAVRWLSHRHPDLPFWLAGFSFGAAVAIRAAMVVEVDGLISIAPAVSRFAAGLDGQPQCPWLIVQGDADELVPIDATVAWVDGLAPGPDLLVFPGGEHFFHGRLVELRDAVMDFIASAERQ